jgi:hypothetical protein
MPLQDLDLGDGLGELNDRTFARQQNWIAFYCRVEKVARLDTGPGSVRLV